MESKKLYRYEEAGRQQDCKVIRGAFGEGARTAPRCMGKESPARRIRRKKAMQRRIARAVIDALSFVSILLFGFAFNWAFWICGDDGPDRVETYLTVAALAVAGAAFLVEWIFAGKRRRK